MCIRDRLTPLPTGGLMNGIYAVRHILCLTEAVFITDNYISFISVSYTHLDVYKRQVVVVDISASPFHCFAVAELD